MTRWDCNIVANRVGPPEFFYDFVIEIIVGINWVII